MVWSQCVTHQRKSLGGQGGSWLMRRRRILSELSLPQHGTKLSNFQHSKKVCFKWLYKFMQRKKIYYC